MALIVAVRDHALVEAIELEAEAAKHEQQALDKRREAATLRALHALAESHLKDEMKPEAV